MSKVKVVTDDGSVVVVNTVTNEIKMEHGDLARASQRMPAIKVRTRTTQGSMPPPIQEEESLTERQLALLSALKSKGCVSIMDWHGKTINSLLQKGLIKRTEEGQVALAESEAIITQ